MADAILRQGVRGRLLDEPPCALSGAPVSQCDCGGEHCRSCGCTDMAACAEGCYWIRPGLCSACG